MKNINSVLVILQKYIRDLLTYDEALIKQGRVNFTQADLEQPYIVVDTLGPAVRLSSSTKFDGDAEKLTLGTLFKIPCTISFYADGAYERAFDFSNMMRSQASKDLQKSLGAAFYLTSGITDVKQLTGQQFGERVELEISMQYCRASVLDVLRIDEAVVECIDDTASINYESS